jgi:Protein of unknown function (DUF2721)
LFYFIDEAQLLEAINTPIVVHVIQLALTPVFLLGGVGAILNVLIARLARIVDRYHELDHIETVETNSEAYVHERGRLAERLRLIHKAIGLCTVCALLVCLSIIALFSGAELGVNLSRAISLLFIIAILVLTGGLVCFLREIAIATQLINADQYYR